MPCRTGGQPPCSMFAAPAGPLAGAAGAVDRHRAGLVGRRSVGANSPRPPVAWRGESTPRRAGGSPSVCRVSRSLGPAGPSGPTFARQGRGSQGNVGGRRHRAAGPGRGAGAGRRPCRQETAVRGLSVLGPDGTAAYGPRGRTAWGRGPVSMRPRRRQHTHVDADVAEHREVDGPRRSGPAGAQPSRRRYPATPPRLAAHAAYARPSPEARPGPVGGRRGGRRAGWCPPGT